MAKTGEDVEGSGRGSF